MKYLFLSLIIMFPLLVNGLDWDLSHKITSKNRYNNQVGDNNFFFELNYQPDFSLKVWSNDTKKIDIQQVLKQTNDLDFFQNEWREDIDLKLYRSLVRFSNLNSEYRLGLQQLNFGPALILRPLQWFDNIDPREENSDSDGVYAFLAKRYFLNNSNLWGWIILDDNEFRDDKSIDNFAKQIEYGGRWQYPLDNTELALSLHHRSLDNMEHSQETRLGFDIRKDYILGFWAESSLSLYHGQESLLTSNLSTVGADYTLSVGNGIYILIENLFISELSSAAYLPNKEGNTAFQVSYPLNLFDSVQSIVSYDWQLELYNIFVSYSRSYDYLSLFFNFYQNGESKKNSIIDQIERSRGIELVLETTF